MSTLLFCTCYIPSASDEVCGVERWRRWIEYYEPRMSLFGADRLALIDDGSPLEHLKLPVTIIDADRPLPSVLPSGVLLFRFGEHLGRLSMYRFPGWWRSFTFASELSRAYRFERLLHIESDAFVISRRMADYMRGCDGGWTSFLQAHYRSRLARILFPRSAGQTFWQSARMKASYLLKPVPAAESAIQVIGGDAIPALRYLHERGRQYWDLQLAAEQVLPFTVLERKFVGDRYGEMDLLDYPPQVDFVAQSRPHWRFEGQLPVQHLSVSANRKGF